VRWRLGRSGGKEAACSGDVAKSYNGVSPDVDIAVNAINLGVEADLLKGAILWVYEN